MEAFAVIVPDRGDRPHFFEFCLRQIERFTLKPSKVYIVNHPPKTEGFDLIPRVQEGIRRAKADGIDLVFIIESDDWYPANYFEKYAPWFEQFEFFGQNATTYYNIKTLRWTNFDGADHKYRSSLFTTGFKISALNNFEWPNKREVFLDLSLWQYARFKKRFFINTGAIGIKHGEGLCGGKGHVMKLRHEDFDMKWLESKVDAESFAFYCHMNRLLYEPSPLIKKLMNVR